MSLPKLLNLFKHGQSRILFNVCRSFAQSSVLKQENLYNEDFSVLRENRYRSRYQNDSNYENNQYRQNNNENNQYRQNNNENNQYRQNNRRGRNSMKISVEAPDWDKIALDPIEKNIYDLQKHSQATPEEVKQLRKLNEMELTGNDIPNPILEFSDYEFPYDFSNMLKNKGFLNPTPIQAQSLPIALSGRDFVGIARTGSGKTLAYALPGMIITKKQSEATTIEGLNDEGFRTRNPSKGPRMLVLAPTRELTQQIHSVMADMCSYTKQNIALAFGGTSKTTQARAFYHNPQICVATPGRLLDFISNSVVSLNSVSYLVLDEADRMLDMGFEDDIRSIIEQTRPDRQSLMWSATWPREVKDLASEFLNKDNVQLNVGSSELSINSDIVQEVIACNSGNKFDNFLECINKELQNSGKTLVFCQTKVMVDQLCRMLRNERINCRGIHGDHNQHKRDDTLYGFREDRFPILVATDVAARGLDVENISLVLNFDMPGDIETYVHRIGRTGRAGKSGRAVSLFTERDSNLAKPLIKLFERSNQTLPETVTRFDERFASPNQFKSRYRTTKDRRRNYY